MTGVLADFLSRHCRLLSLLTLVSLVLPILQLPRGQVKNSVEMWLSPDQPAFKSYRHFLDRYGSEQFIVLATQWTDPLSDEALDQQIDLARRIGQIPSVESTFDFGTIAHRIESSQMDLRELLKAGVAWARSGEAPQETKSAGPEQDDPAGITAESGQAEVAQSSGLLEQVGDVLSAMERLDVTLADVVTITEHLSQAYDVAVSETVRCLERVTSDAFLDMPPAGLGMEFVGELSATYHTIAAEFTRLDIDEYARFVGLGRPDWRTFIRTEPLFQNFIIGPDGHTVGMLITMNNSQPPAQTIDAIKAVIAGCGLPEERVFLAGMPVINVEFDRGSRSVSMRFLPMAVGLGTVALILIIRNLVGCISISITLISSMVWTIGLLIMTGRTMNVVTITLPALLISLALAGNIHMVTHYLGLLAGGEAAGPALNKTIRTMLFPVFMTSLTTAVGFSSVMISDIKPIQDFGLFAAIGIMISCLFNFILLPGFLSFNKTAPRATHFNSRHWTHRFIVFQAWPRTVIGVALVLLGIGVVFAFQTQTNSDSVAFLPKNSKTTRDFFAIKDNLTGLYSLEIDIQCSNGNRRATLEAMTTLAQQFESNPLIAKTLYPGEFKAFVARLGLPALMAFNQDANKEQFLGMLARYQNSDAGGNHWRVSVLSRAQGSQQCRLLQDQIEEELKVLDPIASYSVTGLIPLLNDSQSAIVHTQIRSFSIAIVVILLLIGLFMRSLRALLVAILPNALPIVTLFAFMALTGIALDTATVMIAGIATGIAADDTIHFLACYRSLRPQYNSARNTFIATFDQTGRSITWTSIVAACGFAILLFAPFKPLQYFGLLGSMTMVTAWLGDVIILPACINRFKLWEPVEAH